MTDGLDRAARRQAGQPPREGRRSAGAGRQGEVAAAAASSTSRSAVRPRDDRGRRLQPADRLHGQGATTSPWSRTCTSRAALPWSLPVTARGRRRTTPRAIEGKQIALTDEDGTPLAIMDVAEAFDYDKQEEARLVYRTEEEEHPGVAAVYAQDDMLLGGAVTRLQAPAAHASSPSTAATPRRRAPPSRSAAGRRSSASRRATPCTAPTSTSRSARMEIVDGLLLHPLVGETKDDDIPADVRMDCYEVLLENYYPTDRVLLSVFPAAMRYAGPREAIFHALVRKNYGCSHFIVGRDHAGVGTYYGTYDAQHIFSEFDARRARHHAAVLRATASSAAPAARWARPRPARTADDQPRQPLRHAGARDAGRGRRAAGRVQPPRSRAHPDRRRRAAR